jgi:CRISPR-associated protein Cmr1
MNTLEATFRSVTPLFIGGAEPNSHAELREPSIKGALRFWYRALDPDYATHEAKIFGSTDTGQSCFLLQVINMAQERKSGKNWDERNLPGVKYFSFPFNMQQNKRYIDIASIFTIRLLFKKDPEEQYQRAILASLWLLGHLGGLGSRSRRGFGSVALHSIEMKTPWNDMKSLSYASSAQTIEEWLNNFTSGLATLREWFPGTRKPDHAIFGKNTKFKLMLSPGNSWQESLALIGLNMMKFRQSTAKVPSVATPAVFSIAPDRVAFGVPLTVGSRLFEGASHGRSASRIHIRILSIGNKWYPLVFRLDGPLLSPGEKMKDNHGTYVVPSDGILDAYWNQLPEDNQEVIW